MSRASRCAALALMSCSLACLAAESIAPTRYKTADGMEVIVGRNAASEPVKVAPPTARQAGIRATDAQASHPTTASAGQESVSGKQQIDRDRDRVNILTGELITEGRALGRIRQALPSPRASVDLSEEQLQALRMNLGRHEVNIRSINNELRRTQTSLGLANVGSR